jgi:hypothetical protein
VSPVPERGTVEILWPRSLFRKRIKSEIAILVFSCIMDSGFGIRPNSSISQLENIFANPFKKQKTNDCDLRV